MQYCGKIEFGGHILRVFNTLDEPWFQAIEVSKLIDYSVGNTAHMLKQVEHHEKMLVSTRNSNTTARGNAANMWFMWFISELGLYNVLSQSRKPIAREWRRIVHQELINLRHFDDWDEELEGIYFDDQLKPISMFSHKMPGGDVEQIPVE